MAGMRAAACGIFVTQARQRGLTGAEIAALIGGPAIIATTYGDPFSDHLLAQARRIRLTVAVTVPAAS